MIPDILPPPEPPPGDETAEARIKRLRLRSWRRGIREMDLILGGFADGALAALPEPEIALYDALLRENDHDLYAWITGRVAPPAQYDALLARIAAGMAAAVRRD